MDTSQYVVKSKKYENGFKRGWTKLLHKYGGLITERMKLVHLYKNRTGRLSRGNRYKVTVQAKRLTITNKTKYAVYVRRWERRKKGSDWANNAIAYYRARFKNDLQELGKKVGQTI